MSLKPPSTMLHTKHKVKQGLTTAIALQLLSTQRELCVQVYKDQNPPCLNLQGSGVSLDSMHKSDF